MYRNCSPYFRQRRMTRRLGPGWPRARSHIPQFLRSELSNALHDQPSKTILCHKSSGVNCSALPNPNWGLTMTCGGIPASSARGFSAVRHQLACFGGSDWMAFRRSFGRAIGVLILAATPFVLLAIGVHAQAPRNLPPPGAYQPIPNFAGVGAGLQFRQAINDRFSGVVPTAPAVVRLAFANLPTEQDGALIYCTNCTKTIPCVAGGSGAWAMGQNGQWMCG